MSQAPGASLASWISACKLRDPLRKHKVENDGRRHPKLTSGHGLMRRQSGACRHGESEHTVSGLPYDALGLIPSFGALAPRPVPQQSPRWPVRNGETTRTPGKSTLLNPDQAHVQRGDPLGLAPLGPSHALRRGQGVWLWMVGPRGLGVSLSLSLQNFGVGVFGGSGIWGGWKQTQGGSGMRLASLGEGAPWREFREWEEGQISKGLLFFGSGLYPKAQV